MPFYRGNAGFIGFYRWGALIIGSGCAPCKVINILIESEIEGGLFASVFVFNEQGYVPLRTMLIVDIETARRDPSSIGFDSSHIGVIGSLLRDLRRNDAELCLLNRAINLKLDKDQLADSYSGCNRYDDNHGYFSRPLAALVAILLFACGGFLACKGVKRSDNLHIVYVVLAGTLLCGGFLSTFYVFGLF